jgi:hypothetical protein
MKKWIKLSQKWILALGPALILQISTRSNRPEAILRVMFRGVLSNALCLESLVCDHVLKVWASPLVAPNALLVLHLAAKVAVSGNVLIQNPQAALNVPMISALVI